MSNHESIYLFYCLQTEIERRMCDAECNPMAQIDIHTLHDLLLEVVNAPQILKLD